MTWAEIRRRPQAFRQEAGLVTDAIRETIRAINAAWREGRVDDLGQYFHPSIAFVTPGFGQTVEGRDACVESYRQFLATARIDDYREDEPTLHVAGTTAVAHFHWAMTYGYEGRTWRETGRDLLVFTLVEGTWLAVWRMLIQESATEIER